MISGDVEDFISVRLDSSIVKRFASNLVYNIGVIKEIYKKGEKIFYINYILKSHFIFFFLELCELLF